MMKWIGLWVLFVAPSLQAKVLLITHAYNQPEFIKWQYAALKKFLKDEYEYVVFNDAATLAMQQQIEAVCKQLLIPCYPIPQWIHEYRIDPHPNHRHCDGIEYSLDQIGFDYEGIVAIIDSDLFLIKPFSIEAYLKGYDVAGPCLFGCYMGTNHLREAEYIGYMWPILTFMNMQTMPNKKEIRFQPDIIDKFILDTGCYSYYYFKENPDVKMRCMRTQLDVNRLGLPHSFVLNSNETPDLPVESSLYQTIIRNQKLTNWGYFPVTESMLSRLVNNEKVTHFILSGCEDIQFFEDFTFFHYGRGSLYHGSEGFHSRKALQVKTFLLELGIL